MDGTELFVSDGGRQKSSRTPFVGLRVGINEHVGEGAMTQPWERQRELKFWLLDWRIEVTRRNGRWSLLVARSGTIGRRYGSLG